MSHEIEEVARRILGTPNPKFSTANELRFGRHGSVSVIIDGDKAGSWFDHEHRIGGGLKEFCEAFGEEVAPSFQKAIRYAYRDEEGNLLFSVCRGQGKRFWQEQLDASGKVLRDERGKPTMRGARLVPYHLPQIIEARRNRNGHPPRVYVVEGEKDADRLAQWNLTATTNPGGAGKWRDDYSPHLAGCEAVIIPDNDEAGRNHAGQVAASLAPHAESIRILALKGLPEKGDVSDWISQGGDQSTLETLVDDTPIWLPPITGRILTGGSFIASFVPPDWLIDGIVQRGRLYACTSKTGHGKTAVWLYNACMIQAGRRIGHIEAERGNVLILAGENPEDLKARMIGMVRTCSLAPNQLPYVLPATFPMNEEEAEILRRDLVALKIPFSLIIGDTAASFFPGDDENDNVQAGQYGRTLRTFTACPGNPAVIVLSHPVKNARRDSLLPRGGGAFLNELDGNLTLWSDGEMSTLHWQGKIRGPDFDALTYNLKPVDSGYQDTKGRQVTTIIAQPIDDIELGYQVAQRTANEDAVLKTLRDYPEWSLRKISETLGWIDDNGNPQRYRVQRIIRNLVDDNLIKNFRGKYRLTQAGIEALNQSQNQL